MAVTWFGLLGPGAGWVIRLYQMDLTALMCACSCGGADGSRVAMPLIEAGADVTVIRQIDEMTALKFAAANCEPDHSSDD